MSIPKGVAKYGHKESGSTGKFHPSTLGSGPNTVSKEGGGPASPTVPSPSGSHQPSGVRKLSGKDPLASAPVHKQKSDSSPGSGKGDANPSGVRKFTGRSTPRPRGFGK